MHSTMNVVSGSQKSSNTTFLLQHLVHTSLALIIAAFSRCCGFLCCHDTPLVSGIFYSVPILPKWCRYRRLKEIPVMKNLVVSAAWALAFSLVPVYLDASDTGMRIPDRVPVHILPGHLSAQFSRTSGTGLEILQPVLRPSRSL